MVFLCILVSFGKLCGGYWLAIVFFFKQKTAYEMRISDWSSDVCSSDLINGRRQAGWACAHHQAIQGRRHSAIARTNVAPTAGRGAEPRPPRLRAPTEPPSAVPARACESRHRCRRCPEADRTDCPA